MTISYRIDRGASLLRVDLSGGLDVAEIERILAELLADPDFRPGLRILSDHTLLEEPPTPELVRGAVPLLRQVGDRLGACRCAVVAPQDASFGMARMAEALAEGTGVAIRAFRDGAEAGAWLREADG